MRPLLLITLAAASLASAQSHYGYGFVGLSATPDRDAFTFWQGNFFHAGLGGQARVANRLTVGGEVGVISSIDNTYGRTTALISGGPEFHLLTTDKADVFVTGGGSKLGTGTGGFMAFYGGGLNYWFARRIGLRAEFRDHIWPAEELVRFTGVRFGVTFR